jgi:hypothetical protein
MVKNCQNISKWSITIVDQQMVEKSLQMVFDKILTDNVQPTKRP